MKTALFVGRFQPFHKGHLQAIKDIADDDDIEMIIVGIGSSQYSNTPDNPYSYKQREIMIQLALSEENISKPVQLIAIPDIHNEDLWVGHVESIVKVFDVIYTGNTWVKQLFEKKKIPVRTIKQKIKISGTKLREMINLNNKRWMDYIPISIIDLIKHD